MSLVTLVDGPSNWAPLGAGDGVSASDSQPPVPEAVSPDVTDEAPSPSSAAEASGVAHRVVGWVGLVVVAPTDVLQDGRDGFTAQ